jgi:arginine exporter protein ArgO
MGIDSGQVYLLVRELGGANLASGVVGLASLALPSFVLPAAIASGIFYAVAGVEHVRSKHRGTNETIALVSDLFIAVVLIGFAVAALLRGLR